MPDIFGGEFFSNLFSNVMWGVLPILTLIIIFWLVVRVFAKRSTKGAGEGTKKLLNDDYIANSARTKEIEESLFYMPDISRLPIRKYEDIANESVTAQRQAKAIALAESKMIGGVSGLSNIDLKNMFGPAQLEKVAKYEENFSKYMHALRFWSESLIKDGHLGDAQIVLEESIKGGSEISAAYTLLAEIYYGKKDTAAIKALAKTAEEKEWPGRKMALDQIYKFLDGGVK